MTQLFLIPESHITQNKRQLLYKKSTSNDKTLLRDRRVLFFLSYGRGTGKTRIRKAAPGTLL